MPNSKMHVMVFTLRGDNVYRTMAVTSWDQVKVIHGMYPNHCLGVFENAGGTGGEAWFWYTEHDHWN